MYQLDKKWWERYGYRQISKWWGIGYRTSEWVWYDSTFRFNGGGWLGSAMPYVEYQVGCVFLRRYLKKLKLRARPS